MSSAQDRVSQFLEGVVRNRREILTPEGVALPVDLADHGERLVALIIDLFIWVCVTVLLYVAIIAFLVEAKAVEIAVTLILLIAFFVRNLYFVYFELAWRGATPGKWINRLRVIDRRGGPLMPSAVFARNLTREVEMFLPASLLLSAVIGADTWQKLALLAWLGLFTGLPLFNRDRMRGGDFIAGTIVIAIPKRVLLADLRREPQPLHLHASAARCLRRLRVANRGIAAAATIGADRDPPGRRGQDLRENRLAGADSCGRRTVLPDGILLRRAGVET
jgi:uncharacterized RDD family membrane protein YckC